MPLTCWTLCKGAGIQLFLGNPWESLLKGTSWNSLHQILASQSKSPAPAINSGKNNIYIYVIYIYIYLISNCVINHGDCEKEYICQLHRDLPNSSLAMSGEGSKWGFLKIWDKWRIPKSPWVSLDDLGYLHDLPLLPLARATEVQGDLPMPIRLVANLQSLERPLGATWNDLKWWV